MTTSPFENRPRIKKLRQAMLAGIPHFPINKATNSAKAAKGLLDLFVDYVNWQARLVPQRPRTVVTRDEARLNPRWSASQTQIEAVLAKVRAGDDMTPYLSTKVLTRAMSPLAQAPGASLETKWSDKDFVLNVMGFHHLHLVPAMGGPDERSNEVIFARIDRTTFEVVGLFDHSVFFEGTAERERLYNLHDAFLTAGMPPGQVFIGPLIASSGHTLGFVRYAQACLKQIRHYEPLLDDEKFVRELFDRFGLPQPRKVKVEWMLRHLDVGMYEHDAPTFFAVLKGWI